MTESQPIAIMQPYFFPYIGYFQLINIVDEFILFDTPQFMRHGWIERNRLQTIDGDPFYIKAPLVKHSRHTSIKDILIRNTENWKEKIVAQTVHYRKKAPFYKETLAVIEDALDIDTTSITEINAHSLKTVSNYLEISTPIKIWSEMDIEIEDAKEPDEWALLISQKLGYNKYINQIGGLDFFDRSKYEEKNIEIQFLQSDLQPYQQFNSNFVPGLSIIDVMMFNDVTAIKEMLQLYKLQ